MRQVQRALSRRLCSREGPALLLCGRTSSSNISSELASIYAYCLWSTHSRPSPYGAAASVASSVASVCKTLANTPAADSLAAASRRYVAAGHSFGEVLIGHAANLASTTCFVIPVDCDDGG